MPRSGLQASTETGKDPIVQERAAAFQNLEIWNGNRKTPHSAGDRCSLRW